MPSIEIACIGLNNPTGAPRTTFALAFEPGIKSHRSPASLFQADFDKLSGCLFHIGNPGLARPQGSPFFAYELLSDHSRDADPVSFLEFAPEHLESAHLLLDWLLRSSPERCLLFTSDWQFGPKKPRRFGPIDLSSFWKLHDSRTLLLNAAYAIEGPG